MTSLFYFQVNCGISSIFKKIVIDKLKTCPQRKEHLDETFKAEKSDDGHVSDSDDDEYFPESEVADSDNDDAGNSHFYFLLNKTIIMIHKVLYIVYIFRRS